MPHNTLDLGTLIGSRICHDLINPIGAIGNGLELLTMEIPGSPELALIAESVQNANARVRFFRVAFGMSSVTQPVELIEIKTILTDISRNSRVRLRWDGAEAPNRATLQAAFLAAMCLETVLPLGGEIALAHAQGAWRIQATGRRIQPNPDLWVLLNGKHPPDGILTAGQVQFALLPKLLTELGRQAVVSFNDPTATIRF